MQLRLSLLLSGALVLASLAHPQSKFIGHLPTKHYLSKADFSPTREFSAIFQDSKGFMWFGHSNGIARFDGSRFEDFSFSDMHAAGTVSQIVEGTDGTLWLRVGLPENGTVFRLSRSERGKTAELTRVAIDSQSVADSVGGLWADRSGRVWIGTKRGLLCFTTQGKRVFQRQDGLLDDFVTAIWEDPDSTLWFASRKGLTAYSRGLFIRHPYQQTLPVDITGIVRDQANTLWLFGGRGLYGQARVFTFARDKIDEISVGDKAYLNKTFQIAVDRTGSVWLTTIDGLYNFCRGSFVRYGAENGLLENVCFSVFQDRESTIWVGHMSGVTKILNRGITIFDVQEGLPEGPVSQVYMDSHDNIWLATTGGLVRIHNGKSILLTSRDGLSEDDVVDIAEDNLGKIWVTTAKGLTRIAQHGANVRVEERVQTGLTAEENVCFELSVDPTGSLWITKKAGVTRIEIKGGSYAVKNFTAPGLETVFGSSPDSTGNQWFATPGSGAFMYRQGKFTRFGLKEGLPTESLVSVCVDFQGLLWFGTADRGIFAMRDGKVVQQVTPDEGLPRSWILGAVRDRTGRLWIGGETGLRAIDLSTKHIDVYTTKHGLVDNQMAANISGDSLYCPTPSGAMIIHVNALKKNTVPPLINLTSVLAESIAYSPGDRFSVPYANHDLTFSYVGLSFLDERDVRYEYLLEGYDTHWSPPTDIRFAKYTNLDAGTYRFKVRALNRDNVASVQPAVVEFTIEPPFWATWWFRAMNVAVLLAMGGGGYRYIVHRKLRRQQTIIERQKMMAEERLRISQDVHDSVGSSLTKIALLGEIIERATESAPPEAKERAGIISSTARGTLDEINEIIWSINPKHDSLEGLLSRMRSFAADLFETKGLKYTLGMPEPTKGVILSPDFRRNVFMVFKESIHNLVKYAHATQAEVKVELVDQQLSFSVKDNGVGFDDDSMVRKGHGLENMRARAEKIGGQLNINSEKGRGTEVQFLVKLQTYQ
jgi:signal transduction histidine kinase/ligand-binding sensor domain-containing protein